jgi:hypothetical protein
MLLGLQRFEFGNKMGKTHKAERIRKEGYTTRRG